MTNPNSYYIEWEGADSRILPCQLARGNPLSYTTKQEATKALIAFLEQEQKDLASLIRALQDDLT